MATFDLGGYGATLEIPIMRFMTTRAQNFPPDFNEADAEQIMQDVGVGAYFSEDAINRTIRENTGVAGTDPIGAEVQRQVREEWQAEITGNSQSQIVSEVQRITGTFQARAETIANTALSQAQRAYTIESARFLPSQEEVLFGYDGPSSDRGFCAEILGKAFTREQIARLDNGQGLPVLTSGGGWNCRHSWTPLAGRAAAEIAGYDIATDADVARANGEAD